MWVIGAAIGFLFAVGIGTYFIKHARELSEGAYSIPPVFALWVYRLIGILTLGFSGFILYVIIRGLVSP